MPIKPFRDNRRGRPVLPSELNRLQDAVEKHDRVAITSFGTAPQIVLTPAGVEIIDHRRDMFWAKLTGESSTKYSWVEVKQDTEGTWLDASTDGGRSGTTSLSYAYEAQFTSGLAAGTIVQLELDPSGDFYVFHHEAATTSVTKIFVAPVTFQSTVTLQSTVIIQNIFLWSKTSVIIGTDQNNYTLPDVVTVKVEATSSFTFTGFTASSNGRYVIIENDSDSAGKISFAHQSASSSAANRIITVWGRTSTIAPGQSSTFIYNDDEDRWYEITTPRPGQYWPVEELVTWNSNQNNYPVGMLTGIVKVNCTGNMNLTGITAPSPEGPLELFIENRFSSTNNVTVAHQSASSTAANRIVCDTAADVVLAPGHSVTLIYDTSDDRWIMIGRLQGGAGGGTITVEAADGTPSYSGIDTVAFDENDGYIITNPSSGTAQIDQQTFVTAGGSSPRRGIVPDPGGTNYDKRFLKEDATFKRPNLGKIRSFGCLATVVSNQTIANATDTALTFDGEDFDTDSFHSTSTNNTRLTIPEDGLYLIGGAVGFEANATGQRHLWIKRNNAGGGSADHFRVMVDAASTNETCLTTCGTIKCNQNDYIEIVVRQNSGGNLTAYGSGTSIPSAGWIYRMGQEHDANVD